MTSTDVKSQSDYVFRSLFPFPHLTVPMMPPGEVSRAPRGSTEKGRLSDYLVDTSEGMRYGVNWTWRTKREWDGVLSIKDHELTDARVALERGDPGPAFIAAAFQDWDTGEPKEAYVAPWSRFLRHVMPDPLVERYCGCALRKRAMKGYYFVLIAVNDTGRHSIGVKDALMGYTDTIDMQSMYGVNPHSPSIWPSP